MNRYSSQQAVSGAIANLGTQSYLQPIGSSTRPAGYAAPGLVPSNDKDNQTAVSKTAAKVLRDPLLLRQLSDRVYELMLEDLRRQRERSRNYGGYF
ncbi:MULTISPECIES: hypothetical protein [unclassified Coleofasciculus]|jgi:hypothetical protein|uniref:hypothetical protein n=1 Tax=Cyanophyceae TaxID=3028117 RepID=UPI0018EFD50B|nr:MULTISPECIES: hypothetical protein [unclassified Coleofasciculus]